MVENHLLIIFDAPNNHDSILHQGEHSLRIQRLYLQPSYSYADLRSTHTSINCKVNNFFEKYFSK